MHTTIDLHVLNHLAIRSRTRMTDVPLQQHHENGNGEDMWQGWTTRDGHTKSPCGTQGYAGGMWEDKKPDWRTA